MKYHLSATAETNQTETHFSFCNNFKVSGWNSFYIIRERRSLVLSVVLHFYVSCYDNKSCDLVAR